jgi:probable S-adenosylmethionine-dependent methyltransferase, YraL family
MSTGYLYLVATPIGNLEDITYRAVRTLQEVDLIAAEDTRQTLKLLNHFNISKPLTSYYEHNKVEKGNVLIEQLLEGKNIALVSDAGTPGISDPGEDLVKLAHKNNIKVSPIPGPVAGISGLIVSGLPTGRFVFEGFLPMNKKGRKERIQDLINETRTIIFYEAPHKLIYTLKDLNEILGDRNIVLARELTKKFEEIKRCTLSEALQYYETESPKGEFVVLVEGVSENMLLEKEHHRWDDISIKEHVEIYIKQGIDKKEAMKKVAQERGISKRDVYSQCI